MLNTVDNVSDLVHVLDHADYVIDHVNNVLVLDQVDPLDHVDPC